MTSYLIRRITKRPASRKKVTYLQKTFTTRLALRLRARVLTLLHKTGFTYWPPSHPTIPTLSPPAPLTILPKNPEKNTPTTDVWTFFAGPLDLWTRPLSTFQLFSKVPSTSHPTPLTQGPTLTLFFWNSGLCTNGSGRAFQPPRTNFLTPFRLLIGPYIYYTISI